MPEFTAEHVREAEQLLQRFAFSRTPEDVGAVARALAQAKQRGRAEAVDDREQQENRAMVDGVRRGVCWCCRRGRRWWRELLADGRCSTCQTCPRTARRAT